MWTFVTLQRAILIPTHTSSVAHHTAVPSSSPRTMRFIWYTEYLGTGAPLDQKIEKIHLLCKLELVRVYTANTVVLAIACLLARDSALPIYCCTPYHVLRVLVSN